MHNTRELRDHRPHRVRQARGENGSHERQHLPEGKGDVGYEPATIGSYKLTDWHERKIGGRTGQLAHRQRFDGASWRPSKEVIELKGRREIAEWTTRIEGISYDKKHGVETLSADTIARGCTGQTGWLLLHFK